jgi:acyl-CoA synthetase (AMP-forming)/AMP-acid ligase II
VSLPLPSPLTAGDLLDARAKTRGDHPFLICDAQTLSYAEASERSAALARGMIASGLGHGSRVGLLHPNGPEFVVAALATARIGAVTVPLSTFSTASELQTLLRNADVEMILAAPGYRRHDYLEILSEAVPELDLRTSAPLLSPSVPTLRRVAYDSPPRAIDPTWTVQSVQNAGQRVSVEVLRATQEEVTPADRLVIVHTSGSTAEPKGVIHTHGSLLSHLNILNVMRRYHQDEILFCNAPFFWIGGYAYALLGTLEAGGTLVCSNATEASDVLEVIERTRPTMVNGFAQSVAHLPADPSFARRDLSSIRRGNLYPIMTGEARPADPELLHNMLGMTETGSVCLASDDESVQPEHRRGSFGRPVSDIKAKIIDPESGAEIGIGEVGELCLRGPALMEGYCGRERHETFDRDGWYHSGDLFLVDAEGYYYFNGRHGEMIKTSGANVSPREVEAAISDETGFVAHVFGLDDPASGQLVTAVIRVPARATAPDIEQVASKLRTRLSAYKVPKRILAMDEEDVPMMSSGKLDLRALKERLSDH